MTISSIIVNYHTAALLPGLLDDLFNSAAMETVFVVDNSGELDGAVFQDQRRITLLQPGENIGFAAAVNIAVERLTSDYILLVNPDVRLFPGCLDHLLAAAREYCAVLTGPRFYWDEGQKFRLPPSTGASCWFDFALACADKNRLDAEYLSFYWQLRHERFWEKTVPFAEPFLSGACVLVDRQWACQNGQAFFDPRFFLYFEDTDLSVRAAFAGRSLVCVPAAEALHYYDQSPAPGKSKEELMAVAHQEFKGKYYPQVSYMFEQPEGYEPVIENLGDRTTPPEFSWTFGNSGSRRYFEIGINPMFIPFAQAELPASEVPTIPAALWERQAAGVYFGRIRDTMRGTLKRWQWKKI